MFGIGPMELLLILVVALLVLGPKRMPELARTMGKGLAEFRRASNDLRQTLALDEIQNELRDGLAGAGTIHKPVKRPDEEDRPAQAGDEMPAADASAEVDAKTARADGDADGGTAEDSGSANTSPSSPPSSPSDVSANAGSPAAAADSDRSAYGMPDRSGELPVDADPHAHNEPDETSNPKPARHASAADSNLGSVPVGGATPAGGTPAGGTATKKPGDSEPTRG